MTEARDRGEVKGEEDHALPDLKEEEDPTLPDLIARLTVALEGRTVSFVVVRPTYLRFSRLADPDSGDLREIRLAVGGEGTEELPGVLEACRTVGLQPEADDPHGVVEETSSLAATDAELGLRITCTFHTAPYERQAVGLPVRVRVRGVPVPFMSPEDLILHGLLSGGESDLETAEGVVRREREDLDWEYLGAWARELASRRDREGLEAGLSRLRGLLDEETPRPAAAAAASPGERATREDDGSAEIA